MKNYRIFLTAVTLVAVSFAASARYVEMKLSQTRGNIAVQINSQMKRLSRTDTLILNFDKPGTYTIDRTIETTCNTEMKGVDVATTILEVVKGKDANGKSVSQDDCIFGFKGKETKKIWVKVHDLTVKMAAHDQQEWNDHERHLFKFYHAKKVDFTNVNSYIDNCKMTSLDMRVCSNIDVSNCIFQNYNNSTIGGCVWLRGDTENVFVHDNIFRKYGKDEILAFWSLENSKTTVQRKNIHVTNNKITYGYNGKDKQDITNGLIISVWGGEGAPCHLEDIGIDNNTIETNDNMHCIMMINTAEKTTHKGLSISNNTITIGKGFTGKLERFDLIRVFDQSTNPSVINICGNTVTVAKGNGEPFNFILMRGGNVNFSNNTVTDGQGSFLIRSCQYPGTVTLTGNNYSGLAYLAKFGECEQVSDFTLTAQNNTFSGNTSICALRIAKCNFTITNNTFNSTSGEAILFEGGPTAGNVTFANNKVRCSSGRRPIYHPKSWIKTNFSRLNITGNTFTNAGSRSTVEAGLSSFRRANVSGNSY